MNARQQLRHRQMLQKAAELGHEISFRLTPIAELARCTCNWTARQTRHQNAFKRATLMKSAVRVHCNKVIQDDMNKHIREVTP